jgi:hypothetical protein
MLVNIEFKKINDLLVFLSIILSGIILLRLTSAFKGKAIKKINEDKYVEAIKYQEKMEKFLESILRYSGENITWLDKKINDLPNTYCQVITGTDKYQFNNNKLIIAQSPQYCNIKPEKLAEKLKSFQEQVKEVNNILNSINEKRLLLAYDSITSPMRYEDEKLSYFKVNFLLWNLMDGESFRSFIKNNLEKQSYLIDEFQQIRDVWRGCVNKESLEEQYSKYSSFTFDEIIVHAERKLAKEVIEFNRTLRDKLEDAVLYYIILEEYLRKSYGNNHINLIKQIISQFTK